MSLAPLNNSIVFKKLFSDPEIVTAFVYDLIGIELGIQAKHIELEKRCYSPVGAIEISLDVFVDAPKHLIKIQKVRYDYHFDRLLHYHQFAIVELANRHHNYNLDRAVHTIVWLTSKVREPLYQHSLITTSLSSVTERGQELSLYPHQLYFLNPYYLNDKTPTRLVDWFQLVVESIINPQAPQVNWQNRIIEKATTLIAEENLTPQERAILLEEISYEENLRLHRTEGLKAGIERGKNEEKQEIAHAMYRKGLEITLIAEVTRLSIAEVEQLFSAQYY